MIRGGAATLALDQTSAEANQILLSSFGFVREPHQMLRRGINRVQLVLYFSRRETLSIDPRHLVRSNDADPWA
jgi:hypothetical protein